jgi:hypothetical protein
VLGSNAAGIVAIETGFHVYRADRIPTLYPE